MGYRVVKKAWQYVQPIWYSASVTDGQTDGQTDGRPAYIYYAHKNEKIDLQGGAKKWGHPISLQNSENSMTVFVGYIVNKRQ